MPSFEDICVPSSTYDLPLHLSLDGVTSPRIDGYINRTGDGIGDNLANWNGTEYEGFLQLDMFIAGWDLRGLMGRAYIGYDCNNKVLCIAAHLLANDTCGVEMSDANTWVEFTKGSPSVKLKQTSSGARFQYVKYSGGNTGTAIGK